MGSEKSDEDMELPQATEKVLPLESERAKMLSVGPDVVAQPVTVPEKKVEAGAELDVSPQANPLRRSPGDKVTNPYGLNLDNT
ncbi:hypothetical protein TNIN_421221 [Trichonephila inaurata madagascariensis]|uniref:Uncharacterized protein n=1 Tax=Trichonephila inaurata madagascariensis TaxID=2747483 RepID=A0A8X6YV54_9ARAC|nr:hypothetical protein TNIN_421221 [Trichonephila inaurata madagascariensis]